MTVAAGVTWDTGTTKDIAIDQWAAALLSIDIDGTTAYLQWTADAANEAAAIALLGGITPTGDVVAGYGTVQTKAGVSWLAGTDALETGTGGDVALSTNYYNHINPDASLIGAAVATTDADTIAYATGGTPT